MKDSDAVVLRGPSGVLLRFSDGKVLSLAQAYQTATDWRKRRPTLNPDMPVPKLAEVDDRFK